MATKDNSSSSLLAKMAKFVRHPTKDWSDLDKPEPEPVQEGAYTKQALKEMIERKRQNDFVRKREFDQLRRLRRNEPTISPELTGRPSFFQSSTASNPDERAITLKKIDDIEAQMSKQWWKSKQGDMAAVGPTAAVPVTPSEMGPAEKSDDSFEATQSSAVAHESDLAQRSEFQVTQMGVTPSAGTVLSSPVPSLSKPKSGDSRSFESGLSGFSTFKLFSVELGGTLADPDLEEAAIRFANGDDKGAEAGLLAALQQDKVVPELADGWAAALFDFYRSTGQQSNFDRVAIDYAQRFGRSAPAWFSTPDLLGHAVSTLPKSPPQALVPSGQSAWECPAVLDRAATQALQLRLTASPAPWRLNWRQLDTITPEAGKELADLFAQWCSQPVKLQFAGIEVLENKMRLLTPSGDKQVEPFWWRLRLDALRILRLQDEFEMAALDFCVTFEVSPPAWADARCEFIHDRGAVAAHASGYHPDLTSSQHDDLSHAPTASIGLDSISAVVVELAGEVLGDAAEALNGFQIGLAGADRLVVSCARLIRVDFSAAGSILNWVAVRESEGCQVQFRDVPRLVAAFFNVIGINEHAKIVLRTS